MLVIPGVEVEEKRMACRHLRPVRHHRLLILGSLTSHSCVLVSALVVARDNDGAADGLTGNELLSAV